jgi:hypothetical protein
MKTTFSEKLAWVLLPFLFCFAAVQAPSQQTKSLKWSLALQNMKNSEMVPFSAPVKSSTGEQYRIIIQPEERAFCYVIYESPDGEDMAILFSGSLKGGDFWYSEILELAAPAGSESLFIIASLDEQKNLAQRIADFEKNNGPIQKRALITEIFRIQSSISAFREIPEKPVLMGGATRGAPEKSQGVEFSGLGTYVKTISIEH